MKRRSFIQNMALAGAATVFTPYLNLLTSPNVRKVKITNIKCVRTKIGFRPSLLVKIETDAGIIGIGECHHDENSMGAKDIVLNVIKPILVGQDPYDLERLVFKMSTPHPIMAAITAFLYTLLQEWNLRCGIYLESWQINPYITY